MAKTKNETQTEKAEEKPKENKPIWHTAETLKVKELRLMREEKDENLVKGVKFITNENKEICYFLSEDIFKLGEIAGIQTETKDKKKYLVADFVLGNPMLQILAKNLKTMEQTLTFTYQERVFNGKPYYSGFKNQFTTIYYPFFHKDTKDTLDKQMANKNKYEDEYGEIV